METMHIAYQPASADPGLWHVVVGRRLWRDPSVVPLTR